MRTRWIVIPLLLLGLGAGGWFLLRPKAKTPEYRTGKVEKGSVVAKVTATGTLKPVTMVQVGSQVSGTIQSLHADFNSSVKKGELVAQLDPSLFRTQLAQNEANLTGAEVNVADAERTLNRSKELLTRNLVSQSEVDASQAALDRAKAEVKQATATVEQARVNLEHTTITSPIDGVVVSRNVDVGQTVAASLSAPILFEIAKDLTAMQVEASVDEADIGRIQVSQPVSFTVDAFPDAPFKGVVSQIRLQPITVQNVVTYTTVIAVANPEMKLRPGMTANVSIEVARRDDVLKVPAGALTFRPPDAAKGGRASSAGRGSGAVAGGGGGTSGGGGPGTAMAAGENAPRKRPGGAGGGGGGGWGGGGGGQTVWLKSPDGGLRPAKVHTGITDGYFTEITSGELKEGDEVVIGQGGAAAPGGMAGAAGGANRNPFSGGRRGPF